MAASTAMDRTALLKMEFAACLKITTATSGWHCEMGCGDGSPALHDSIPRRGWGTESKVWLKAMTARCCSARAMGSAGLLEGRSRHIPFQRTCRGSRFHGCSAVAMGIFGSELRIGVWYMSNGGKPMSL